MINKRVKTRKIITVVGPTASGKTDLSRVLSEKFNGEVISADSRQIYRGMDIGTGKDKSFFQHMVDIRNPKENYSVAEYQKEVYEIIDKIFESEKTPFLVGGTGLYINAILYGYQFPKTDPKLRARIEKLNTDELTQELKKYDPASAEKNKNNHRRLARALESYLYNLRPLSKYKKRKPKYEYLIIGIDIVRDELYKKIDKRVDKRIKLGMIEEVENMLKLGITHERLQRFGLEYRYIDEYLQKIQNLPQRCEDEKGNKSKIKVQELKSEMIQKLKYKIHDYARRQLTWFRKNKEIRWIRSTKEAEILITNFLN